VSENSAASALPSSANERTFLEAIQIGTAVLERHDFPRAHLAERFLDYLDGDNAFKFSHLFKPLAGRRPLKAESANADRHAQADRQPRPPPTASAYSPPPQTTPKVAA